MKIIHIIKRKFKILINNILSLFFILLFLHQTISFAQDDIGIKRNFSDSITKSFQIIVKIPEKDNILIADLLKDKKRGKSISYDDYLKITPQILSFYENQGYPFIVVGTDSLSSSNDTLFVQLKIQKNQFMVFDSIVVKGDLKISKSYMYSYLNYKTGKRYKESIVREIPKLISEIPFAVEVLPSGIEFSENSSTLYLFLNKKRVNQFDGIIGFAPINQQTGKIGFTGDLKLRLLNTFTYGESIDLQWRATEPTSQLLDISTTIPYIVSTPFGIDALFHLDKKDTSYLKLNLSSGVIYSFKGTNFLKLLFDYTTSSIISQNSSNLENENLDIGTFSNLMYGFAFNIRKLDFIYNPRKGYHIQFQGTYGAQTSNENGIKKDRLKLWLDGKSYIPVYKKWVSVIGLKSGTLWGDDIYLNELYRVGGMKTLQGFDELSIYASSYVFGHLEMRFLYEKLSYFQIFYNGGWYEKRTIKNRFSDTPYGFGIGVAFNTKAGIFNLSYALGKQMNNPISFKTGKIHFGLLLTF